MIAIGASSTLAAEALRVAREVVETLDDYRLAQNNEAELQGAIEKVLREEGFLFEREARLSARDRPDFLVAPGVALEVKVNGSVPEVERQLKRYAESARVAVLLLVTTRGQHLMPAALEGKPVLTLFVGSAFK